MTDPVSIKDSKSRLKTKHFRPSEVKSTQEKVNSAVNFRGFFIGWTNSRLLQGASPEENNDKTSRKGRTNRAKNRVKRVKIIKNSKKQEGYFICIRAKRAGYTTGVPGQNGQKDYLKDLRKLYFSQLVKHT